MSITIRARDNRNWLEKAADDFWAWLKHVGEEISKFFAKVNQEVIRNSGQGGGSAGGGPSVTGGVVGRTAPSRIPPICRKR